VPINQASTILPQLREKGRVSRGYIGVALRDVDADLQKSLGLKSPGGALVQDVTTGSPGARAGLRPYDVIVAVDGKPVLRNDELIQDVSSRQPGTLATLQVVRDGRSLNVPVKLASVRCANDSLRATRHGRPAIPGRRWGLSVREIDPGLRSAFQSPERPRGRHRVARGPVEPGVRCRHRARTRVARDQPAARAIHRGLPSPDCACAVRRSARVVSLQSPRSRAASCTPSKLSKPRILVIDDESAIRDSLKMILEYEGYQFVGAVSGQDGLATIQRERPDAVLLDIKMPGMDGMEVLRKLHALDESLPVIMISGHGSTATTVEAIKSGAVDYFREAAEHRAGDRHVAKRAQAVGAVRREPRSKVAMESRYEIVGQSPTLRRVLEAGARAQHRPSAPCCCSARAV
jgi:FixJ family two-component response regulator